MPDICYFKFHFRENCHTMNCVLLFDFFRVQLFKMTTKVISVHMGKIYLSCASDRGFCCFCQYEKILSHIPGPMGRVKIYKLSSSASKIDEEFSDCQQNSQPHVDR